MNTNHKTMSNRGVGLLFTLLLSAALTLQANAYTVTTVAEAPQWQIDWSGNQARPDWTEPDGSLYENWTILVVQIEDALKPYVSADDMMAIFVDGELRGLASPAVIVGSPDAEASSFVLKVWSNESSNQTVSITLKYYNSLLKNIFSLTYDYTVGEEEGVDEDFIPPFSMSSAEFPVVTILDVKTVLEEVAADLRDAVRNGHGLQSIAVAEYTVAELLQLGRQFDRFDQIRIVKCVIADGDDTFRKVHALQGVLRNALQKAKRAARFARADAPVRHDPRFTLEIMYDLHIGTP